MSVTSIRACRERIAQLLQDDAAVSSLLNEVYAFRTLKYILPRTGRVTYIGGNPFAGRTQGGGGARYDFSIPVFVAHDGSIEAEEAAENALDDIELAIYHALLPWHETQEWVHLSFPHDSIRPRSPAELPNTRILELFVRVRPR